MKGLRRAGAPPSALESLGSRMRFRAVGRRQILFAEGTAATHVFAIRTGAVKLVKVNSAGREQVTDVLGPGDLFGFETIFETEYSASAETLTECELCAVSRPAMERLVAESPSVALHFAGYLHRQLSQIRIRQMSLGAITALEKFAAFLLHAAPDSTHPETEQALVAQHLTLKELGGILGLSPETVCRVRSELTGQGLIETTPTGILIKDVAELRRLASL